MRNYGVNYDTGLVIDGRSTRSTFSSDVARRELEIIATDLHATAVRVSGDDPERLSVAGAHAARAGLELWFSPFPYDLEPGELVEHLTGCARRAEQLRRRGCAVVLVLGCEMSLFCSGFVPGTGLAGRLATMTDPLTWSTPEGLEALSEGGRRAREVQREIAAAARSVFAGPITYAAGAWEDVEWELFDIVSVDAYRDGQNAAGYRDDLHAYHRFGKPVAVTEFGCCTYCGAADRGGTGWMILDRQRDPVTSTGDYQRDEQEQVRYLKELLAVFEAEKIDSAFWFSFAGFELPHRPDDPGRDLDLASYGLVAMLGQGHGTTYPDLAWEPKLAFHAVAEAYARSPSRPAQR
ncbi:MAG TPA: hypothetical protein VHH34_17535 [Pseudonocardiaceae bacterium]|nr:hypothetical protein [Pseudonocardiaceae bacterium]